MKKIYSLLLTLILAIVGTGDAWAQIADGNYYLKHKESGLYLNDDTYPALIENKGIAAVFSIYKDNGDYVFETNGKYLGLNKDGFPEMSIEKEWFTIDGTIDNCTISTYNNNYFVNFSEFLDLGTTPEYWTLETVGDDPGTTPPPSYEVDIKGQGEDGYYGTFYAEQACEIPEGYTVYVVDNVSNGNVHLYTLISADNVKGRVLAARVPVIIKGAQNTITLNASKNTGSYASNNLLAGSTKKDTDREEGFYYYKLSYDSDGTKLGFYWEAGTGGTFITTLPNKAYLKVPISQGGSNALSFRFEDTITGIVEVQTNNEEPIYNLQGVRVNGTASGIYVKNGNKYIVK